MRTDTRVWYLFQSIGRPAENKQGQATIREITLELAKWLMTVYMGSKIRITLARTESELHETKRDAAQTDMLADLESMLGGTPEPDTIGCVHGNDPQSCEECRENQ